MFSIKNSNPNFQNSSLPSRRSNVWRTSLIMLSVLFVAAVIAIAYFVVSAPNNTAGQPGSEFLFIGFLLLIVIILIAGACVSVIAAIIAFIYWIIHRSRINSTVPLSIIIGAVFIAGVVGFLAWSFYHSFDENTYTPQNASTVDSLSYKSLTEAEATQILNDCQVLGFYYPGSSVEQKEQAQEILTTAGILLVSNNDGRPIRIHVSEDKLAVMVPIARNAQKSCPNLQFWNGQYERRDTNGNWVLR